ncbi:hypothetical protein AQUCO_01000331v1 [Aquilegia coerulea]|uniref:Cell wall hydroxyproline-rich glycoprotein n=1 Tax=Aquilegia coerulea TaxID=218851 RepID=A0A2G5E9E7_AQUCA|nr:hypothetical protein AQUCO_01000331v1 [Aquilegia coerulea]
MQASGCSIVFFLIFSSALVSFSFALSDAEASYIASRQLLTLPENGELPNNYEYEVQVKMIFANRRLRRAYIALQALKHSIFSDPLNTTGNWDGPDVCNYTGVFCAQALDDSSLSVVAGLDLNHADLAGFLPVEIGLMTDLALIHINSNRFCGILPKSLSKLVLLHELDVSNNRFVGPFPEVVVGIPNLRYLDIRYNDFEGSLPPQLFDKELDAFPSPPMPAFVLPPNIGFQYASPPPPMFPGYN